MSDIKIFEKEEFGSVRVVMQGEDPWFVAKDIAEILEYENSRTMTRRLDEDEKAVQDLHTPGGKQNMSIINESGLYNAILGSQKPEAKRFKKWVTSEVLPAIRKTGGYSMQQMTPGEFLLEQAKRFVEIEKKTQRALDLSLMASEKIEENEVKIESVESRLNQIETAHDHFTVMGYCSLNKIKLPLSVSSRYGKEATAYCKENNIEMGNVPDPRFGRVNTYPLYVLQQIIEE